MLLTLPVRIGKDHTVLRPPTGIASVIYTMRAALLTRQRFVSFSLNTYYYCSFDSLVLLLHCDRYRPLQLFPAEEGYRENRKTIDQ